MGSKYTEAQKRATQKYLKSAYDDVKIRVQKGKRDEWRKEAEKRNKSLNQFVIDCVEGEIEKDAK